MLTIKTDRKWRPLLSRHDVPAKVLESDFDWTNEDDHSAVFFKYRGRWYHALGEFMRVEGDCPFKGWDAYCGDSFFSGVLVKFSPDCDEYQAGTYFS
jgi:hypothetical protein